jgi:hypothetical protein
MGNLIGGIASLPFLIFSLPAGYIASPSQEKNSLATMTGTQEPGHNPQPSDRPRSRRQDIILSPLYVGSYMGGIGMGTPFYPFALIFPRDKPAY